MEILHHCHAVSGQAILECSSLQSGDCCIKAKVEGNSYQCIAQVYLDSVQVPFKIDAWIGLCTVRVPRGTGN